MHFYLSCFVTKLLLKLRYCVKIKDYPDNERRERGRIFLLEHPAFIDTILFTAFLGSHQKCGFDPKFFSSSYIEKSKLLNGVIEYFFGKKVLLSIPDRMRERSHRMDLSRVFEKGKDHVLQSKDLIICPSAGLTESDGKSRFVKGIMYKKFFLELDLNLYDLYVVKFEGLFGSVFSKSYNDDYSRRSQILYALRSFAIGLSTRPYRRDVIVEIIKSNSLKKKLKNSKLYLRTLNETFTEKRVSIFVPYNIFQTEQQFKNNYMYLYNKELEKDKR